MSEYAGENVVNMAQWKAGHDAAPKLRIAAEVPATPTELGKSIERFLQIGQVELPHNMTEAAETIQINSREMDEIQNNNAFNTLTYSAWLQGQTAENSYEEKQENLFKGYQGRYNRIKQQVETIAAQAGRLQTSLTPYIFTTTATRDSVDKATRVITALDQIVKSKPTAGVGEVYVNWLESGKAALEMAYSVENKAVPQAIAHS